jgi:hypothetical protein
MRAPRLRQAGVHVLANYMRTILYMLDWYKQHSRAPGPATEASR